MKSLEFDVPEKFLGLYSPARHKALFGGRGSGKSHQIGEALVAISAHQSKRIVCGRQFQNSINDSVKDLIEQKIHKLNVRDGFKITDREIKHNSTGSRFSFIGLDRNPDSQKSLEGVDIFWGEEAHTFNERSMEIIVPTIRKPWSEMWWSWNPRFKTDPVDNLFRGGEPPKNSFVQEVHYYDNPYFYQTELPAEMETMKMRRPKRYEHVWLGKYDENADAIIFNNTSVGLVDVPLNVRPVYGLDFGFSGSPDAVIKAYVLHEEGIIYIAAESFGHVSTKDLPELIQEIPGARTSLIRADSARPETIDYLVNCGMNVIKANKPAGSVMAGIKWLQGFDIVINPECKNMIEEARMYMFKVDPLGKPLNIPVDAYNHGWDALRYACEEEMKVQRTTGGVSKWRTG